jgi:hypothetical protein
MEPKEQENESSHATREEERGAMAAEQPAELRYTFSSEAVPGSHPSPLGLYAEQAPPSPPRAPETRGRAETPSCSALYVCI